MASRKVAGGGRVRNKGTAVLDGGKTPRLRKPRRRDFTKKRQTEFLAVLADTSNVSLACREVDISVNGVYKRRQRDAAFRKAWQEALATAYRKLELVLLERAFAGTEKIYTRKDGGEERVREYPNAIALQLLKMHRDEVVESEREFVPEEVDEIRKRFLDKLERLRKREEGKKDDER